MQPGLEAGFSATLGATTTTPSAARISETFGLSLLRPWLTAGHTDAIAFGEDSETVWASDLVYDSAAITASGATWYASSEAVVDTVDLGTDRTVAAIAYVAAAANGSVAFSVSFDGGATWKAYHGGWRAGTMTADELNAVEDWPAPPMRLRMNMAAGSRVNGLTINYERS